MFVCDTLELPNSRVFCAGVELCNSLGDVEWLGNPVQVKVCDHCFASGCSSNDYVHISRLGEFVLWSAPQSSEERHQPLYALETRGAIAIPAAAWRTIGVPAPESFPLANNRALADAWALGPGRPMDWTRLVPMLRGKLVGGDTLEKEEAVAIVERLLAPLLQDPDAEAHVDVVETADARIETLYFDGPAEEDWPALAFIGGAPHIALNREYAVRTGTGSYRSRG